MPIPMLRIALGNGQSYQTCDLLTDVDMVKQRVHRVFGRYTCCFRYGQRHLMTHALNLRILHLSKERPEPDGAYPYERIVLNNDEVFGPGFVIPNHRHMEVGVPDWFTKGIWFNPVVVTCLTGLIVVIDANIASLESRAAVGTDTFDFEDA